MGNNSILSFGTYASVSKGHKLVNESLVQEGMEFDSLKAEDFEHLDLVAESSGICTLDMVFDSYEAPEEFDTPIYEGNSAKPWLVKAVNAQSSKIKPDIEKALKGLEMKMSPSISKVVDAYINGLKKALAKSPQTSAELFDLANKTSEHKYVVKVLINTYNKIIKDNTARAQSSLFSEDNKRSSSGLAVIQTAIKEAVFNIKEEGNRNGEKNNIPKTVTNPKPWTGQEIKED